MKSFEFQEKNYLKKNKKSINKIGFRQYGQR